MADSVAQIVALARQGDIACAIERGAARLAREPNDAGLAMFIGVLHCRNGEMPEGIDYLRRAMALAPDQPMIRIELARALLSAGLFEEAGTIAAPLAGETTPPAREMQRIRGHALVRGEDGAGAEALFGGLVRVDPGDFESWHGLGVARLLLADVSGAIAAIDHAVRLRPSLIGGWIDLARAHSAAFDPASAVAAAERATGLSPDDAAAQTELARALAASRHLDRAMIAVERAEAAAPDNPNNLCELAEIAMSCKAWQVGERLYHAALELQPGFERGWRGIASILERTNQVEAITDLIEASARAGIPASAMALPRARALRQQGRIDEAFDAVALVPLNVDPVGRAQLLGDLYDRKGDTDAAFAAFSEANDRLAASTLGIREQAEAYRSGFVRAAALVTPRWYAGFGPSPAPDARRAPMFLFGFPRSGTTLIDTMLGGHPDAVVLEEEASVERVAQAAGSLDRLGRLGEKEIARLRTIYWAEVDRIVPDVGDRLVVDKQPLALGSTPILHRIFPDARYLFAERHPCDVVLSCFITSAHMDAKVANFFEFVGTAKLYDAVLGFWHRCRDVLDIDTCTTRYERLIADPETELRNVAQFAGLAWDPRLLDHRSNAASRRYIASPSYAQVAEPLYTRAKGRWLRYRHHMAPVLPILQPWLDRLGYASD